MNADHELERRIADFYATEAPPRAPDRVLEAALATIDTTRQRRALLRVPWRYPNMNGFARYAIAAVAVIAIGAVGFAILQPGTGPGAGGPAPTASPSPSPEAIPRHAIEETFSSSINGISVRYPTGWSTRAAIEPWTTDDLPAFDTLSADVMYHAVREDGLFLLASSKLIGSASFDTAATTLLGGGECGASRPVTVGGAAGVMGTTCHMAVVQSGGRLYVILLYVSADAWVSGGDLQEEFDDTFFESVLATVHLDPP
jgi:hypothetical protein